MFCYFLITRCSKSLVAIVWHSYNEVALPNYLVHLSSHNAVIVDIYMEQDLNKMVNGGDLDDGGDDASDFEDKMRGESN